MEDWTTMAVSSEFMGKTFQAAQDLDDLVYHEPARCQEVTEKLNVVNRMLRNKLAEASQLILCIEFGCDICHPDQGVAYE